MKQAAKTFPVLGIARKFPSIQCQIADSLDLNSFRSFDRRKTSGVVPG